MRPLMLAALVGLLFVLGCAKEQTSSEPKEKPARRMLKPGENPTPKPSP